MEAILTLAGIAALMAAYFITAIVAAFDMKAFLARTPELRDETDMQAYRRLVGRNMLAALLTLLFGVPALILIGVAYYMEYGHWLILTLSILATTCLNVAAMAWTKSLENRLKKIPTAHAELRDERDRVVEVWHKKMLPDW